MRQDNSTVYIIVNAIPPYGYEINQFLACPIGAKNVVRFKRKWLPEISDPDELVGKDGVLILRDWSTAHLIPLRRLRVISVLPIGEIYDIEWIADEIIEYATDEKKRDEQIDVFNKHMHTRLEKYQNLPQNDLKNLVFLQKVDYTEDIKDQVDEEWSQAELERHRWGKIVDIIGRFDHFIDIDFIKVLEVRNTKEVTQPLVDSTYGKEKRYKLNSRDNYRLTIYQRTFTKKPRGDSSVSPRTIILKSDTELIKVVDGESQISGKYGGHRFRFKTRTLRHSIETYLVLHISRNDGRYVPSIYVPVKITTPLWLTTLRILSVIFFMAGTFGLFLADVMFPNNPALARNISILIMIIAGWEMRDLLYYLVDKLELTVSHR